MSVRSDVWKYFDKKETNKVVCKICSTELSYNTTTTGTMRNHLKNKHPTIQTQNVQNQPTISSMFQQRETRHCDKDRANKISELILNLIIKNLLPISIVETAPFRELITFLEPEYTVPSRTTIQTKINLLHSREKEELKNQLFKAESISITTDAWTSLNAESYSTITAHYFENWTLKSNVLATVYHEKSHTAENLMQAIKEVCDEYCITDKIFGCIDDNASNIMLACKNLEMVKYNGSCAAHSIQLSINKGFDEIPAFKKSISACSKLVSHFKHSYVATNNLRIKQQQQNLPQHKLIQRCNTRWNSTYDMFERILEQRWAVSAVLSDRNMTKINDARLLELKDEYWSLIEEALVVLKPFKIATTALSPENTVTFSSVSPIIISLVKNHLALKNDETKTMKAFKNILQKDLKDRFSYIFEIKEDSDLHPCIIACFLDPKYKHLNFYTTEERNLIEKKMLEELERVQLKKKQPVSVQADPEIVDLSDAEAGPSQEPATKKRKDRGKRDSDMQLLLGDIYAAGPSYQEDPSSTSMEELSLYINSTNCAQNADSLIWRQQNSALYPRLSKLAKIYLCIPASSVPSERMFSAAGRLVSKCRNRISAKNVDSILFLNKNITSASLK